MCFRAKLDDHIPIPPHDTGSITFVVKAMHPGPFNAQLRIFVDVGYLAMPTVSIEGSAVGEPITP